jgi:peptidoglycan/LPS O-acetylase OafA/YrhL
VTIFFFLSGYLIATLLRLEGARTSTVSLRKFYVRRALRILPPLYITLAVALVLGLCGARMKALRWIGTLSYALYLCHLYILRELQIRHPGAWLGTAAVAMALSLGYAWAMNRLVETPLKRWRLRLHAADAPE